MSLNLSNDSHRRYNPLTGEWIQVSPHRAKRPWQGKQEKSTESPKLTYDPFCYLCPGNQRSEGGQNPSYKTTFVFQNDFSALRMEVASDEINVDDLLIAKGEKGICKVICFSPRHDLSIPEMELDQIRKIVDTWNREYAELSQIPAINYIQIFENKGEIMGCSNPHPHGQIWAQQTVPDEPAKELYQQGLYFVKHGRTLLGDYLDLEIKKNERIVAKNEHFTVLVPFWAFWPFETMIISHRAFAHFTDMNTSEKDALADILKQITVKYDNIFEVSFPYSAGFHCAPTDGKSYPEWHFHMHFYPPLLRSAEIKKFSVGYEMLANPQRDITPEASASLLKKMSIEHYKNRV